MKIINIYRLDQNNIGDLYSTPVKYFNFLKNTEKVDIWDKNLRGKLEGHIVIVGGGGLILRKSFIDSMNLIVKSKAKKLICWGVGHNVYENKKIEMPEYLNKFDLVGVRDNGYGYEWVPCPSCLHPAFDKEYKTEHEIVIYEHTTHAKIPIEGFPKLANNEQRFEKVIEFLGSGEIVLTSTYHGVYWSTLLNKKVIIINPFSSKFYSFKHKHPIANINNWRSKIKDTKNYPEALDECREANLRFAKKVRELISREIKKSSK